MMPAYRYRSPHAHLVGKRVTLTRPVTHPCGYTYVAGTPARVIQAHKGLSLLFSDDALVTNVSADSVEVQP